MKALGASHLRFFVGRQREKERVALSRHEFGLLLHQKRAVDGIVLFTANCVSSAETNIGCKAIQTANLDQPKTVRVRFKLHRQCEFGQRFLVVGDDPNLGSWDPSGGVPLNWSEGHVWTAEVDVPCGKVISYKFVLEEIGGTVSWQPGPDRVLETWDSAKTISVSENWDSPDFQNVVEDELVEDLYGSSLKDPGFLIAQSWGETDDVREGEADGDISSLLVAEDTNRGIVREGSECSTEHSDEPSSMLMVAENISVEQDSSVSGQGSGLMSVAGEEEEETALGDHGKVAISESDSSSLKNETRLFIDKGVPVLIPGLATLPPEEVVAEEAEALAKAEAEVEAEAELEAEASSILEVKTTVFDEIVDSTDPQLDAATESAEMEVSADPNPRDDSVAEDITAESGETGDAATKPEIRVSAALPRAEESEAAVEEKPRLNGNKQILDNDMQWGRRALHKFLANLGFMQHR